MRLKKFINTDNLKKDFSKCPYFNCDGALKLVSSDMAYCTDCFRLSFFCLNCGFPNRSRAMFCRICGNEVIVPESDSIKYLSQSLNFEKEFLLIQLKEKVNSLPSIYRDCLFFLTESGRIYELSPYSQDALKEVGALGIDFSKSPFIVTELESFYHGFSTRVPYLLSICHKNLVGFDLTKFEFTKFVEFSSDKEIIYNSFESFVSIVEVKGRVYFFSKNSKGKLSLTQFDLKSGELTYFEINEANLLVGPFKISTFIGFYSISRIYLLREDGKLFSLEFPPNFKPLIRKEEFADTFPSGLRPPYIVVNNELYIQGSSNQKPHFLYFVVNDSNFSNYLFPTPKGVYGTSNSGYPIFASEDKIIEFNSSVSSELKKDEDLIDSYAPFHVSPLIIGFVKSSTRVMSIRFYNEENDSYYDFNISKLNSFQAPLSFYHIFGAIILTYISDNEVGAVVWK